MNVAGNSFGQNFRITTFGESHGGAVGVVIDGVPPNLEITLADIQKDLDRRKPGQSDMTTPRKEPDKVSIMSGYFQGQATGTPMLLILYNKDANPSAYYDIKNKFRPGHADYTYLRKYGIRDWRGSGRASGRETAGRVAAGAVAKKILANHGIGILAYVKRAAGIECTKFDPSVIEKNPMRACDPDAAVQMVEKIKAIKDMGDSVGGIVECRIKGAFPGLGDPVFDKLEACLAHAMLSIGAVRGFEIGSGFKCVDMKGSEHNDELDETGFISNNAGGIIGGISTGQEIVFRIAVKPTASISSEQKTITRDGKSTTIQTEGRHDPIICPRIVPVVEAMSAIVLADHIKRQAALIQD